MTNTASERKHILNVCLYLLRMTHDGLIEWESSNSDCYSYEAEVYGWRVKVGEKARKNQLFNSSVSNSDHFVVLENLSTENLTKLDGKSIIDDLFKAIEKYVNPSVSTDTEMISQFENTLRDKTGYEMGRK